MISRRATRHIWMHPASYQPTLLCLSQISLADHTSANACISPCVPYVPDRSCQLQSNPMNVRHETLTPPALSAYSRAVSSFSLRFPGFPPPPRGFHRRRGLTPAAGRRSAGSPGRAAWGAACAGCRAPGRRARARRPCSRRC